MSLHLRLLKKGRFLRILSSVTAHFIRLRKFAEFGVSLHLRLLIHRVSLHLRLQGNKNCLALSTHNPYVYGVFGLWISVHTNMKNSLLVLKKNEEVIF